MHAFDYLAAPAKSPPPRVCVLFGDEKFLKQLVAQDLRNRVADDSDDVSLSHVDGSSKQTQWRDVHDELATVPLFGGARVVLVDDADTFVSTYRKQLEDYVARPSASALLLLDVASWPANTKLYKSVEKTGLAVECRAPLSPRGGGRHVDEGRLRRWLSDWARDRHDIRLEASAAARLVELSGPHLGLLDQNLAKLALFVEPRGRVTADLVTDVVGGWRAKTAFAMVDAAADGNTAEALCQLDRLILSGEHPVALLAQMAAVTRRLAAATRIVLQARREGKNVPLDRALVESGTKFGVERAVAQLSQLSSKRASRLNRWLLDADAALKGSHSSPTRGRLALELLLARMSSELSPRRRPR